MNIKKYEEIALSTLTGNHSYGDVSSKLMAQILGLVGESGEVAEKFKKILRDKNGELSENDKNEIAKELGDILWYVTSVSHLIGFSLEDIAKKNNEKLLSRKDRNQIKGVGDNR